MIMAINGTVGRQALLLVWKITAVNGVRHGTSAISHGRKAPAPLKLLSNFVQIALQNTFDLLKYAMTLAAARPSEFKWTALGSVTAVGAGAICYAVYLKSVRGHLVHLDCFKNT